MRIRSLIVSAAVVLAAVLALSVAAFAQDNWVGTWKLSVAKSKCVPGPPPKNLTLKFEARNYAWGGAEALNTSSTMILCSHVKIVEVT
jgi:hypothetical protein